MKSKLFTLAWLSAIAVSPIIMAQDPPKKFGDIDMANLKMTTCELDSNASAVVLFDWGKSEVVYRGNQLDVELTYHKRVKILRSDAFDEADVEILNRKSSNLTNFKAATYNLVDGKIKKIEVTKESIFDEDYSKTWEKTKFTFPDLKEGSIIEYTYQTRMGSFVRLNTWYFQGSNPVNLSEYYVIVPEWLEYKELMGGYELLSVADRDFVNMRLGTTSVRGTRFHYVARDLPAFKEEPYMTTSKNYISKIDFELQTISLPGQGVQEVLGTYASINKDFMEDEDFGGKIRENKFFRELAESIAGDQSGIDKAKTIYEYVSSEIKWDGDITLAARNNLKKIVEEKEGTSAGINLLLVTLLRNAGFTAHPVIYSTRSNGKLHPVYAIVSRFNDVLGCLEFDGKEYLLDGTDEFQPFNMLPYRSLNGQGLIISETGSRWIDLIGQGEFYETINGQFQLDDLGTLTGSYMVIKKGYDALELRDLIKNDGEDKFVEDIQENEPSWTINSYELHDLDDLSKPTREIGDIEIENAGESLGNIIYLNPIVNKRIDENPFKLEDRKFPVDFACSQNQTWMFTIEIPEGFVVDELPQSKAFALPEKGGAFQYNISQIGNKIQVLSRLMIRKSVFLPNEYQILREFYIQVADKHAETVVLKRNT